MELEYLTPLQTLDNSFHSHIASTTTSQSVRDVNIDVGPAAFADSPQPVNIQETYESVEEEFEEVTVHEESTESSQPIESSDLYEELESEFNNGEEEREEGEGLQINDGESDTVNNVPDPEDLPVETIDNAYGATLRFSAASWFDAVRYLSIDVLGIGGIGSHAALAIARLFPASLHLYDYDSVDEHNLAGQLYRLSDVGLKKVFVLKDIIRSYCPSSMIYGFDERVTSDTYLNSIVICGFDNMAAREAAFNAWLGNINVPNKKLFIDARLSAEYYQIFCFTAEDTAYIQDYKDNWLFPSSEAEATACSYKQTTFASMMLGGVIANLVVNFANNCTENAFERSLPYMITYDAELMQLKCKY